MNNDASNDRSWPVVATVIGFPFESYWICVGTPPQQQHEVGCVLLVVVMTTGGWVGGVLTIVTGTTCTEQFAELVRPCPSVALTVANFVPVVPNDTLRTCPNPLMSLPHWNVTGKTPPAYPATKFTILFVVTVGLLTEHATLNIPVTGVPVSTSIVVVSLAVLPSRVQVIE